MKPVLLLKQSSLVIAMLVLAACEALPSYSPVPQEKSLPVEELQNANAWINLINKANRMSAKESASELKMIGKPKGNLDLFYYGLLNQQLKHRDGWVLARDAFRKLASNNSLAPDLHAIARLLESHNQALINWHERHLNLQKELAESVRDRELLQSKIEALTDIEATISNRKQQNSSATTSPKTESN